MCTLHRSRRDSKPASADQGGRGVSRAPGMGLRQGGCRDVGNRSENEGGQPQAGHIREAVAHAVEPPSREEIAEIEWHVGLILDQEIGEGCGNSRRPAKRPAGRLGRGQKGGSGRHAQDEGSQAPAEGAPTDPVGRLGRR